MASDPTAETESFLQTYLLKRVPAHLRPTTDDITASTAAFDALLSEPALIGGETPGLVKALVEAAYDGMFTLLDAINSQPVMTLDPDSRHALWSGALAGLASAMIPGEVHRNPTV